MRLRVDLARCTGCRRCETACAFFHTGKVGADVARIRVLHLYESGIDGPGMCVQCRERYCLACLVGALSIGDHGQIVHSPTVCTLCGACRRACPIGAVEIFRDLVYICDLCGGRPRCVEACTEEAITIAPEDGEPPSLADLKRETRGLSPAERRRHDLERRGRRVRDRWERKHA